MLPKQGSEYNETTGESDSFQTSQMTVPKDNRFKAIVAINACAVFMILMTATYKVVGLEGVGFVEFSLLRNAAALLVCSFWCFYEKINPIKMFPWHRANEFFWRCVVGHLYFIFMNIAAPLAPLSLVMILAQTSPFWTTIIAYFVL